MSIGGISSLLPRTITGRFAAAKRHMIVDARSWKIDHDHPGLCATLKMGRVFEAGRADARRKTKIGVVRSCECLVVILYGDNRSDRAKYPAKFASRS